MTRVYFCRLECGPYDGDEGWATQLTDQLWAYPCPHGRCKSRRRGECDGIHWGGPNHAGDPGAAKYAYSHQADNAHIFRWTNLDLDAGRRELEEARA